MTAPPAPAHGFAVADNKHCALSELKGTPLLVKQSGLLGLGKRFNPLDVVQYWIFPLIQASRSVSGTVSQLGPSFKKLSIPFLNPEN
jgi:hypothetical protein